MATGTSHKVTAGATGAGVVRVSVANLSKIIFKITYIPIAVYAPNFGTVTVHEGTQGASAVSLGNQFQFFFLRKIKLLPYGCLIHTKL